MELTIYTDGASRNNPGEAGAGVCIVQDGKVVEKIARYLGTTTNNIAEYSAAIIGLEHAVTLGAVSVKLLADSELLVKQVNGQYKVKNEGLKPLYAKVRCRNSLRRSAASRYNTSQGSGTGKRTLSPIKR